MDRARRPPFAGPRPYDRPHVGDRRARAPHRRVSARRVVAGLVAAAAVLVGPLVGVEAAPARAATPAVTVLVAPRGGGIVPKGKDVDVDVTVTNTGDVRLGVGLLAFSLDPAPVASTTALVDSITTPVTELQGNLLTRTTAKTPPLDPGATRTIGVRVTKSELNEILTDASGARRLYVRYSTGSVRQIGVAAVVRMTKAFDGRIGLGTVVPLLAPANTAGLVDTAAQAVLTARDGEWSAALDAARQDPSATVALDTEVLASIRLAGPDAPADAVRFLDRLQQLPNQFVRLPYADGDTSLQRAAGAGEPLSPTSFDGASTTTAVGAPATPTPAPVTGPAPPVDEATAWSWSDQHVTWPVPGTASTADVSAGGKDGGVVLLSSSDIVDDPARVLAGPAARIGSARVLVADARASRLLADSARRGMAGQAALAELTGLLATAAVTRETPAVLAVPGRAPEAEGIARVLGLLGRQSWISGRSLAELAEADAAPATVRLGRTGVPAERVATAKALIAGDVAVRRLGRAMDRPSALVGPERLALLGALSAAWRADEDGWTAEAGTVRTRFADFVGGVHLTDGANINVLGNDGTVKISVDNDLARPVTVRISATVSNSRLQVGDASPTVKIAARSRGPVPLSVRAIANGPARMSLTLETAEGDPIGSATREVTVRAGFDTIIAVALLSALGVLLALGVYRNVTRRRHPRGAAG